MRGDRAARDTRHNKDHDNLKSSLKKGSKPKKNRVVFDESANEFFEADYIIVVRDECGYSDEGEGEECSGCGSCERYQEPEPGALSPPEGYKDMGLFNRDGTLREQAWWEAGDVVLVGERSGTVFTPQHLQLLRRLQRERMLRSTICADCDAHAALHQPLEMEYGYEEEETSDVERERELRPVARRTGKHIAAGEERPRINSSQQTTPTEESPPDLCIEEKRTEMPVAAVFTSEESDTAETEGRGSCESSPLRQRRGGILKGGRLWKSLDMDKDTNEQNDDQRSTTTASDEDGSVTPRSVRFVERPKEPSEEAAKSDSEPPPSSDTETSSPKEYNTTSTSTHRLETPLILTLQAPKTNSAVQQLFNSSRPPPPAIEPQLVTSETLRAWDAVRPKAEEAAVRRVAERNALRCSLLRSEARKKQQPKQETTSLAERIRLLTCDVEDEPEEQRSSPAGASVDKFSSSSDKSDKSSDKSFTSVDKSNEKAFGSASSSSSSSTLSAPVPPRQQPPDLGDVHQEPQKPRAEPRRQFLSTLAPLTACVGSAAHHEGFYYVPPGDRTSASSATNLDLQEHNDAPAPDVLAGTPGAGEGDDGLAAFARAAAPRTERLRQRYGQESQPASSDDEHDDYGFHRRPAVRGIAVKQQLGASDEILQQLQNELQPSPSTTTPAPAHACQRTNSNYSWPYYSEANLNSRPQSRASATSNWSKSSDYVSGRQCGSTPVPQQHSDACYAHAQNMAQYAHYAQRQQDMYRNCSLYANVGCSDSSQELYGSQTSSEQTSPVRSARCRRPESPPPIRSHHQLLYVPYSTHYHYQHDYGAHWTTTDYARMHPYYQQQTQSRSGASTPQPTPVQPQRAQYTHALQIQTLCPAPARYRPVPAPQPGGGKQMICYSEKVAAPLYQPAPGSPSRAARGAPEGAPSGVSAPTATSPMAPPPNPVYYAMNV
ncbi:uncharacterized protein LOC126380504 isoform X2 [Pectinophora gossypiella]|uniref:uncharacterized protein LOC126380504 isoform X2 n=1 Tax=Pectinophora gossypiella TaxID=13191 RepID=UPI00214E0BEC|nr:uncharacterized protein LOC126380504 isoform X2 [Pectinophora gossypiella]